MTRSLPKVLRHLFATAHIAMVLFTSSESVQAADERACERFMQEAAREADIPVAILRAVGLAETGADSHMQPFALNIAGESLFPGSAAEAMALVRKSVKGGEPLVDIGCMQINYRYHRAQFRSLQDMVDPESNIRYAAKFLGELRDQHGSWTMAVAHYHASREKSEAQRRYVCRVVKHLVDLGFGRWTPEAKGYCNLSRG